jgi:AcrR family transcriptional regulator
MRPYMKRRRAESEAETRDRIIEAVVALHQEVGPARTTISAIAARAGVQRLTVYRHFPVQSELIAACAARWSARMPPPDLEAIATSNPRRRNRELLIALYRYYRSGERMLSNVLADADEMPPLRRELEMLTEYLRHLVGELERAWPRRSSRRRTTLEHAVQFSTWQSLSRLTGSDAEAADLVLRWCRNA